MTTGEIMCEMSGEYGDIVSRVEACAAYTDDGLVRPFGDIDMGTGSLERII